MLGSYGFIRVRQQTKSEKRSTVNSMSMMDQSCFCEIYYSILQNMDIAIDTLEVDLSDLN